MVKVNLVRKLSENVNFVTVDDSLIPHCQLCATAIF